MIGGWLRKYESAFVNRILGIIKLNVNPNSVSLLSLVPAAIAVLFFMQESYITGLILMQVSIFLDMLDGAIARKYNRPSKFGAYLDPMLDKFTEFFMYLGLFLAGFKLEAFLAFSGIMLIGSAKSWTFMVIPIKNFDWPGIGDRADRYSLIFIAMIASYFYPLVFGLNIISIALWIIILQVYIGTMQRMLFAKKIITKS
jgi:archaetidylinositol phosphate synthase